MVFVNVSWRYFICIVHDSARYTLLINNCVYAEGGKLIRKAWISAVNAVNYNNY